MASLRSRSLPTTRSTMRRGALPRRKPLTWISRDSLRAARVSAASSLLLSSRRVTRRSNSLTSATVKDKTLPGVGLGKVLSSDSTRVTEGIRTPDLLDHNQAL